VGLKRMMAIVAYSCLPMLIQTALSMVVLFLKDPEEFNLQNPLMFNVGAFLSPETPAALRAAGSSIDLFTIWIMILIAIGVSTAPQTWSRPRTPTLAIASSRNKSPIGWRAW